ncbi:MAG: hypothetical protein R6U20_04950 [Longimonas sp.]
MDSNASFEGEEIRYNPEMEVVEGPDLLVARSAVSAKVADMCSVNNAAFADAFVNDDPKCCGGGGGCCFCAGCEADGDGCSCPEEIIE